MGVGIGMGLPSTRGRGHGRHNSLYRAQASTPFNVFAEPLSADGDRDSVGLQRLGEEEARRRHVCCEM
jgi:hypothetical protein